MPSQIFKRARDSTAKLAAIIILMVMFWSRVALAASATNTVIDSGGGSVTLTPSGPVTVNSVNLALVKQARDPAGAVLPNGSNVSPGQQIYFILYVDNPTITSAIDIRITDLLNESQFTYVPNSMETTAVPSGSNDAAIWGGVWTAVTDGVGGPDDLVSITNTGGPAGLDRITIGGVVGQANQTVNIPGGSLRAIRFRVTVN
ncbi:MAG: hypothetical protein WAO55_10470 [Candidatus Manganitrophaceae bacterium]